jgi:hypothetical protein
MLWPNSGLVNCRNETRVLDSRLRDNIHINLLTPPSLVWRVGINRQRVLPSIQHVSWDCGSKP